VALATATILALVTPPAKTDKRTIPMVAASAVAGAGTMPPVTPSKYIAAASAHVYVVVPPGQPQKTLNAKQLATDSFDDEIEDESKDVLPALGATLPLMCHKFCVLPKIGVAKLTSSEQCPTQVTHSAAVAPCKPGKILSTAANKANVTAPSNKIPSLQMQHLYMSRRKH
jgi:cell division cycle 14